MTPTASPLNNAVTLFAVMISGQYLRTVFKKMQNSYLLFCPLNK